MRADFDLEFLQYCDNEDLVSLCNILMFDNDGNLRLSESLSNSDSWLECFPYKMRNMWEDLANELQCYGGNSILNVFRIFLCQTMTVHEFQDCIGTVLQGWVEEFA